jgi:hypothetical protein
VIESHPAYGSSFHRNPDARKATESGSLCDTPHRAVAPYAFQTAGLPNAPRDPLEGFGTNWPRSGSSRFEPTLDRTDPMNCEDVGVSVSGSYAPLILPTMALPALSIAIVAPGGSSTMREAHRVDW